VTPGQSVLERCRGRPEQQIAGAGHAAAEHEAPGIENRREVGQSRSEPAPDRAEAPQRGWVAFPRGGHDRRPGDSVRRAAAELQQS